MMELLHVVVWKKNRKQQGKVQVAHGKQKTGTDCENKATPKS